MMGGFITSERTDHELFSWPMVLSTVKLTTMLPIVSPDLVHGWWITDMVHDPLRRVDAVRGGHMERPFQVHGEPKSSLFQTRAARTRNSKGSSWNTHILIPLSRTRFHHLILESAFRHDQITPRCWYVLHATRFCRVSTATLPEASLACSSLGFRARRRPQSRCPPTDQGCSQ